MNVNSVVGLFVFGVINILFVAVFGVLMIWDLVTSTFLINVVYTQLILFIVIFGIYSLFVFLRGSADE